MTESIPFMKHAAILDLITGMADVLRKHLDSRGLSDPAIIGIHTGGAWVADRLNALLGLPQPCGLLDISFYRDDFTQIGVNPQVRPSKIDFDVDDRNIVLVDDVLETGRTIRAAMNEIFDYGRPATITLVTLIERPGRDLPIQPDVIGLSPPLAHGDRIKLDGPDPLSLEIFHRTAT
ncbi:MAG: bifunctional pyr operon transcriptional regulator/uracil phosphoribosyltransferase PyrR [Gammaproteobacteria bacterium]|nr:bifunctional pyr operon transcriptional regulator/uracil phosphoribosyltransferase PyrR [Gammaproteobacteria bacterium]MCB1926074.1 bifunctional pyr operon transcriptional regulator/uracil phosphoribosyltransferase PyrR [Gammaproteobacteria bacterium]